MKRRLVETIHRYRRVERDLILFALDFTEAHRNRQYLAESSEMPYVVTEDDLEEWGIDWIAKHFPSHERPVGLPPVMSQAQNGGVITAFPSLVYELLKRDEAGSARAAVEAERMQQAEELARAQQVQGCIWGDVLTPMLNAHAVLLEKARDAYLRGDSMMTIRDVVTNMDSPIWNGPRGRLDGATVTLLPVYRAVAELAKVRGIEQGILREDGIARSVPIGRPAPAKRWVN